MPTNTRVTQDQISRMVDAYAAGKTCRAIAHDEGIHHLTVSKKLHEAGVEIKRGGNARQQRTFSEAELAEMIEMGLAGKSRFAIAQRFHSSQSVVTRILEAAGQRTTRRTLRGSEHGSWKGGRTLTEDGYVLVKVAPDDLLAPMRNRQGYVPEHRLVMARSLGRPLTRRETVHHRGTDKSDNRIENLQLRSGGHGKHQAFRCLDCGSHNVEPVGLD